MRRKIGSAARLAAAGIGLACLAAVIPPLVDLELDRVQVSPYRPQSGDPVQVVLYARNTGSHTAYGPRAEVRLYQGSEMIRAVTGVTFQGPFPKNSVVQSVPASLGRLLPGIYRLEIILDPEDNISELDESNNRMIKDLQIAESD